MRQPTTLGAFSVSLAVKNLEASRDFYEKLDFEVVGGDPKQNWLILRNGSVTLGLFQGMFERNLLTFNRGGTKPPSRSKSSPTSANISAGSSRRAWRSRLKSTRAGPGRAA